MVAALGEDDPLGLFANALSLAHLFVGTYEMEAASILGNAVFLPRFQIMLDPGSRGR